MHAAIAFLRACQCVACSEERVRRISTARTERAQDRHFRQRADSRRQLKERTQAASASEGETEEASARAEPAPEPPLNVLIKADVQVHGPPLACRTTVITDASGFALSAVLQRRGADPASGTAWSLTRGTLCGLPQHVAAAAP